MDVHIRGGKVSINNAAVTQANVLASNGVVHVIDTVLIPPATLAELVTSSLVEGTQKNIVELAASDKDLSTLVTAVKAGNLVGALSGAGPFTVFAPTNEAFAKLPAALLMGLLKNPAALDAILEYHVVAGKALSSDLHDGETIKTLNGKSVDVHIQGGKVSINNAAVTQANILASNGVVHVIDTVLIPPAALAELIATSF